MRWFSLHLRCKGLHVSASIPSKTVLGADSKRGAQGMSEDRKRYFQKLKGNKVHGKQNVSQGKSLVSVSHGTGSIQPRNERLRFLAGIASNSSNSKVPIATTPNDAATAEECVTAVDFTLVSMKDFAARSTMSGCHSSPSNPLVRKRPHYDGRLRALNKKFTRRLALLRLDFATCFRCFFAVGSFGWGLGFSSE